MIKKWWLWVLFISAGAFCGAFLMHENTWDFANYHYYNPWALFNNRIGFDIAPASVNTYFNPLIDIPFYLLVQYLNDFPRFVSAIQGIFFGILLFVFFKICVLFFIKEQSKHFILWSVFALIIGGTGFAVFSQISSTTNEIQISILILWAFYLLFKNICFTQTDKLFPFILAGFLCGCALGLKLTSAVYVVSMFLTLCCFYGHFRHPCKKISLFSAFAVIGFLLLQGWWMWKMWLLFENPLFPFFNEWFQSDFMGHVNFADTRYRPNNPVEYFFYPFIWAVSIFDFSVSEQRFVDFRFAVFFTLLFFYLLAFLSHKKNSSLHFKFFIIFFLTSYVIWLFQFSILRYAIPMEMMIAIFITKFFHDFLPVHNVKRICFMIFMFTILGILVIAPINSTKHPSFQRNKDKIVSVESLDIPDNSIILLYKLPCAGVIPSLIKNKNNVRVMAMDQILFDGTQTFDIVNQGKFSQEAQQILQNHTGKIIVLINQNPLVPTKIESPWFDMKNCRKLQNSLNNNLLICM